jgi:hypothetical protein
MVLAAGGAVLASLVSGCGPHPINNPGNNQGGGLADPGPYGLDPAVLEPWRAFPVGRTPRPILLIGAPLRETGYRTDDAKLAVMTGRFELAAELPSRQPAKVPVRLPDGDFQLPVITATEAYEGVRDSGNPGNAAGENPTPLRITGVELASAPFATDRGELDLPAWLFHAPDSLEPLAWPALRTDAFWRLGDLPYPGDTYDARLAGDGVTLTVTMPAPHPGACPGDPVYRHRPVVLESATAVAIGIRREVVSIAPGTRSDSCGYDAMLRTAPYEVKLSAPLGPRVLVSGTGGPVAVTNSALR